MSGNRENEKIKNKVVGILTNIIDEVDPKNVLDLLIERRIINIEYREKIMNEKTKKDRCRALIYHLLECSHNEAFIVFRQALDEHYHWIVERIDVFDAFNENQDDFKKRYEKLMKELNETKMKLQDASRKTEHYDELQKVLYSTKAELNEAKTELEEAKREMEILKQELGQKIKLENTCTAPDRYVCTSELLDNKDFEPDTPTRLFDDSSMFREGDKFFIVGMKIHTRRWDSYQVIGAMEVIYNTGQSDVSAVHGSKNPKTAVKDEEFRIGQNEYITEIIVWTGCMLDRLAFKTNKGISYGPYGGKGGDQRRFVCPCKGAFLAYITGGVDDSKGATVVRRLNFFWEVPKSA